MNKELIKKNEQDKIIELMCQILELNEKSEEVVKTVVKKKGLKDFFLSIQELEIENEEKERITALKEVIDTKEKEIVGKAGDDSYGH